MANFAFCKNWKFWYYTLQLWQILWNNFVNWILWKSEREPDEHGKSYQRVWQEAENRQRKKFWQCVYAALSLTCVSVFIAILLFLFFIFHNLDNKPWTSIFLTSFTKMIEEKKKKLYNILTCPVTFFSWTLMNFLNFEINLIVQKLKDSQMGVGRNLKTDNKKGFSNVFTLL